MTVHRWCPNLPASLCNLCVLCVSVVIVSLGTEKS
jgi:hypothetical protein